MIDPYLQAIARQAREQRLHNSMYGAPMGGYIEGVIKQRLRDRATPEYKLPRCRDLKRVGERFLGPRLSG